MGSDPRGCLWDCEEDGYYEDLDGNDYPVNPFGDEGCEIDDDSDV